MREQVASARERATAWAYLLGWKIVCRLRAGGLVCLLCERDLTGSGIEVEFFGEPARMMGGPAALAVHTGAALMPVTLWYRGPYWCARIHPEIAVPSDGDREDKATFMTQQLARVFETAITQHPEDWHMLQKVFVADLDPDRLAQRLGEGDGSGHDDAHQALHGGHMGGRPQRLPGGLPDDAKMGRSPHATSRAASLVSDQDRRTIKRGSHRGGLPTVGRVTARRCMGSRKA